MAFLLIPFLIILLVFYSGASLNVANRMCELSKFGGKLPALQCEVFMCSTPGMDGQQFSLRERKYGVQKQKIGEADFPMAFL